MQLLPGGFLRGASPLERACCPSVARFCVAKKHGSLPTHAPGRREDWGEPGVGGERETGEWGTGGDEDLREPRTGENRKEEKKPILRVEVVNGRHRSAATH